MNLHTLSEKDLRAIVDRLWQYETEVVDRDDEGVFCWDVTNRKEFL